MVELRAGRRVSWSAEWMVRRLVDLSVAWMVELRAAGMAAGMVEKSAVSRECLQADLKAGWWVHQMVVS